MPSMTRRFSSHRDTQASKPDHQANDANFTPTRVFYIVPHNLWSTSTHILDLTNHLPDNLSYSSGEISDTLRDTARTLGKDAALRSTPAYVIKRKHWWNKLSTIYAGTTTHPHDVLAEWTHPAFSTGKAHLTFPASSAHSTHALTLAPASHLSRTNGWVQDSVAHAWECDSRLVSNRMTLVQTLGGGRGKVVVARYAQRWGSWVTGGVLLVMEAEVDVLVAVLTAVVMLRKMQQRAGERRSA